MKGLNRAFRAVLALSLVLCMVMSCVTVSAATPVTLEKTAEKQLADGLYEVKYTVSGFAAAEGDATILVYSGTSIDSATIAYPGQKPVAALESGFGYEFVMELEGGVYTVIAGGTGMGKAAEEELTLDTAPEFADTSALTFDIKTDATEVGPIREAADYDDDEITYAVESEIFEVKNGKIVVREDAALAVGTYNLTLTAAANGAAATNPVPVVINVTPAIKYVTGASATTASTEVPWGTTLEKLSFPTVNVTIEGEEADVWDANWGTSEPAYNPEVAGAYVFTGEVAVSNGYELKDFDGKVTFTVNVAKREISSIEVKDIADISWGETPALAANATVTFADGGEGVLPIEWTADPEFAVNKSGEFTYTATVDASAYTYEGATTFEKTFSVAAKPVVTIATAKADKEAIEVDYNTSEDAVLAELEKVVVTGEGVELEAEWAIKDGETYVPTAAGTTYTYVATLSTDYATEEADYKVAEGLTVEVTVTVLEDPTIYITAIGAFEDEEIDWGEEYEIPTEVTATFSKDVEDNTLDIVWNNAEDFNNEKAGVYELTGKVVVPEEGYELEVENVVTLKITVGQKTYVIETGSAELKDGDKYYIEGEAMGDAVVAAGDAELTISGGEYCSGQTPVNEKQLNNTTVWALGNAKVYITGGYFTAYGLPEGVNAGQIDMIYAKENAEIYISGGRFEAIGDRKDTVWLLNIKDDAVNAKIEITGGTFVGWNPATAVNADELTIPEDYTVEYNEATNEYTVVAKASITEIPTKTIYVLESDDYEDYVAKLEETIPGVKVEGKEDITITGIIWPLTKEDIVDGATEFPAQPGEFITVKALSFEYDNEVLNKNNLVPEVKFVTVPDSFAVTVNGVADKASIVTLKDEAVTLKMTYAENYPKLADINVAYQYAINGGEWVDVTGNEVEIPAADFEGMTSAKVSVRADIDADCFEDKELSKKLTIFREGDLFSAQMYFNPSEAEDANDQAKYYSAFRVNKARDLNVVFDVKNYNDAAYDFSGGEFVVTVYAISNEEGVRTLVPVAGLSETLAGAGFEGRDKVVFEKDDLAELNGAYSFKLAYVEGDEELFTVSRTTHIGNTGIWFNTLTLNGNASAASVVLNRNKDVAYSIVFDGTNAEGKVYAGYEIVEKDASLTPGGETVEVVGNTWNTSFALGEAYTNSTYKLYSYANLTDNQSFYDMVYGRTIFLANGYTNLCRYYMNGSTNVGPTVTPEFVIKPHWGGRPPVDSTKVFYCRLYFATGDGEAIVINQENVEGGEVKDGAIWFQIDVANPADAAVTILGADEIFTARKINGTIELWAGEDAESLLLDKSVTKAFWPAK